MYKLYALLGLSCLSIFAQSQINPLGVTVFPPLSTKESPFMLLVSRGSVEAIAEGLRKGASANELSLGGQTTLMIACQYNTPVVIKFLVEAGADVNQPDFSDYTPLMASAGRGDTNSVALLIEKGANLEARSRFGDTALHVALGGVWWIPTGPVVGSSLVGSSGSAMTLKPQLTVAKMLLKAGANVNATDMSGQNLFIKMASHGITLGMDLLKENGLPVDQKDEGGMTAFMWAAQLGYEQVLRELIRLGANPQACTEEGRTALDLLRQEEPGVIRITTERGTMTRRLRHPPNRKEIISYLETLGTK